MTTPECPDCGSPYVRRDTAVRIDRETNEIVDRVEIFECSDCGTVFKEVEDDD